MSTTLPSPPRTASLRRTRSGRVAAGVCSGLGAHFGLDPVLFRVLFATSAFFGGVGILAYLLAWAVIPDEGTEHAAVDGWVAALRRRRVPVWLVAVVGGLLLWGGAATWWRPGPPLAGIAVVGIAVAVLVSRRQVRRNAPAAAAGAPPTAPPAAGPVDGTVTGADTVVLTKDVPGPGGDTPADLGSPAPLGDQLRDWVRESREARRARVRRSLPVRIATLVTLVLALTVEALVDAASGVELQLYLWTAAAVLGLGLLAGAVLRRGAWSLTVLLVPALLGGFAFAGSTTRLGDGAGHRHWVPAAAAHSRYRLAFGSADLDLRALASASGATRVDVTVGAGDVRIRAPRDLRLTVDAHVHLGGVELLPGGRGDGGVGTHQVVRPPAGAAGAPVTVVVHVADGRVLVDRR